MGPELADRGGRLTLQTASRTLTRRHVGYEVIQAGSYVMLAVRDTGSGIPAQSVDRIFEPFFSSKPRKTSAGTGLGLSVVHGIVREHGGYIDLHTRPGRGTEFRLYFPVAEKEAASTPEPSSPARAADGKEALS